MYKNNLYMEDYMKKTMLVCLVVAIMLSGCSSTNSTSVNNNVQATENTDKAI